LADRIGCRYDGLTRGERRRQKKAATLGLEIAPKVLAIADAVIE
jgi:hypothetical protein